MRKIWNYIVASCKVFVGFAIIAFGIALFGFAIKVVWKLFLLGFNLW